MSQYLSVKVDGKTLEVGQNLQIFLGTSGWTWQEYVGDARIIEVSKKGYGVVNVRSITTPTGDLTLIAVLQKAEKLWTHLRVQLRTDAGLAYHEEEIGKFLGEGYLTEASTGYYLPLDKSQAWGDTDRTAFYERLVARVYRHLKGVKDVPTAGLGLRAEGSLLIAMLMLAEDMKNSGTKSFVTDRAKKIRGTLSKLPAVRQTGYAWPLESLNQKKNASAAVYDGYIKEVRAEVQKLATSLYEGFYKGPKPVPQTLMVGVGDGSETMGVLGKGDEGCGLFSYNFANPKKYAAALQSVGEGNQSVVHFFVTGINETSAKASVTLDGGSGSYKFDVKKDGTSGKFTVAADSKAVSIERTRADGAAYTVHVFPDGSTFDGARKDFTFAPDAFGGAGGKPLNVTIECDGDETLFGLSVVPAYGPIAMLGLYPKDGCVPWADGDARLTDAAAKRQVHAAHLLVAGCARLANKFSSYEITMNPGGIGKRVGDDVVSAPASEIDGLRELAEAQMQELRASFLLPKVEGNKLKIEIRSYTDPDYADHSKAVAYNKSLSARRCWGILGLLVKKLNELDPAKAKKLWAAMGGDSNPAGKAGYLADDPDIKKIV